MRKFTQKQKWLVVGLSILGAGMTAGTICGIVYGTQIANQHHEYFKMEKNFKINVETNGPDTWVTFGNEKLGTYYGPSFNQDSNYRLNVSSTGLKLYLSINNIQSTSINNGDELVSVDYQQSIESLNPINIQFLCTLINNSNKVLAIAKISVNVTFNLVA